MTKKIPREEQEYFCEDCGCEISYYQWLMRTGQADNEGFCEECWSEFLENLFNDEEE